MVPRTFLSFRCGQEQQLGWGSRQSVLNMIRTEDFSSINAEEPNLILMP